MLEKTEGTIVCGQSRDTCKIGYKTQKESKQYEKSTTPKTKKKEQYRPFQKIRDEEGYSNNAWCT